MELEILTEGRRKHNYTICIVSKEESAGHENRDFEIERAARIATSDSEKK